MPTHISYTVAFAASCKSFIVVHVAVVVVAVAVADNTQHTAAVGPELAAHWLRKVVAVRIAADHTAFDCTGAAAAVARTVAVALQPQPHDFSDR